MVEHLTLADINRLENLQPDGWSNIRLHFQFYCEESYCFPLKIEKEGRIAALGCQIAFNGTSWLAHIIVAPQFRRDGLGSVITSSLLKSAEDEGCTKQLLVATEMGAPLYEKLGFQHSHDYNFYQPPVHSCKVLSDCLRPMSAHDLESVYQLDRQATGEDRKILLEGHLKDGMVHVDSETGKLSGYYLPELCDGPIVATDPAAGGALMALRCQTNEIKPVAPADNIEANNTLVALGCTFLNTAKRMVRNGEDPLLPKLIFNRIGGNLG